MKNKNAVEQIISTYLERHSEEDQDEVRGFIASTDDDELFDRKNFSGHITASAIVLDPSYQKMLLLRHKYLHIDIPPGGHVDDDDESIRDAAIRETSEEAAIKPKELVGYGINEDDNIPLDINSHVIPPNDKKDEPAHTHHDFRYLFVYNGTHAITPDPEETENARWINIHDLLQADSFSLLAKKIQVLINDSGKRTASKQQHD